MVEEQDFYHFNPLPPHGGRRTVRLIYRYLQNFNPLPPHGGRLRYSLMGSIVHSISIHSLRMEGDHIVQCLPYACFYFNPLPPHGGRLWKGCPCLLLSDFNPLPPHGGRLQHIQIMLWFIPISIHSLRMEGDSAPSLLWLPTHLFQSTPSAWRETFFKLPYLFTH